MPTPDTIPPLFAVVTAVVAIVTYFAIPLISGRSRRNG